MSRVFELNSLKAQLLHCLNKESFEDIEKAADFLTFVVQELEMAKAEEALDELNKIQ